MTKHQIKTAEIAKRLGVDPDVKFVKLTSRGTVSFTVGKPNEILSLWRAVRSAGLQPSRKLVTAVERL